MNRTNIHIVNEGSGEGISRHTQIEYATTCLSSSISHCDAGLLLQVRKSACVEQLAMRRTIGARARSMAAETFLRDDRTSLFRRRRLRQPAIARDFLVMDDNVVSDPRRREE